LPRFSCANHKLSVAINKALINQIYLLDILKQLSSSNGSLRNCLQTNRVFRNLKCRPKTYQKTRWLGGILLLFSNKRAYDKGAFTENIECPISLEKIEIYIQILLPSYYVTLGWEKNGSSISCVIPSVLYMVNAWDKMEISDAQAKELCYFLIHFVKVKFKFELESEIYHVITFNYIFNNKIFDRIYIICYY
jgi:hypothetical protein